MPNKIQSLVKEIAGKHKIMVGRIGLDKTD